MKHIIAISVYFLIAFLASVYIIPLGGFYLYLASFIVATFLTLGLVGGLTEEPSNDDGGFHPYP